MKLYRKLKLEEGTFTLCGQQNQGGIITLMAMRQHGSAGQGLQPHDGGRVTRIANADLTWGDKSLHAMLYSLPLLRMDGVTVGGPSFFLPRSPPCLLIWFLYQMEDLPAHGSSYMWLQRSFFIQIQFHQPQPRLQKAVMTPPSAITKPS